MPPILFALSLSLSRATGLGFYPRFFAAFSGMTVSTAIATAGAMVHAAGARRALVATGRPVSPGHIPRWGAPLLFMLVSCASAAAAYVSM
jgi:hypothetical protein